MPSLGIEMRRNGFIVEAVGPQSSSLLNQLLMVMELFEVPNRSDHSVLGAGSPCPVALQVDVLTVFKDRMVTCPSISRAMACRSALVVVGARNS